MRINSPILNKLGGLLSATTVRAWMGTLDYKGMLYDPANDPASPDHPGPMIYVFWHEYILFPIYLRGHCDLAMLLSQHRDAEILSYAARHLGFEFVRGSSTRGGVAALRELMAKSRHLSLAITPDGPRGPRRTLAQGAVYLSSRLGMPIVAMGFGFDQPWRAGSWDRFAIPRPFSRARALIGPALTIPPDLDRDGIEHYRQEVERLLNRLTTEAEAWASSSTRKAAQVKGRAQPARRKRAA